MTSVTFLKNDWHPGLASILRSARDQITVSSPYVTSEGTEFLLENVSVEFRSHGHLDFVTNLSPTNQIQGVTNPNALLNLTNRLPHVNIHHLPRLHAKVYVSDSSKAIITSANLTLGGLKLNHEYGVLIEDRILSTMVLRDIHDYASLGTQVKPDQLSTYCSAVEVASSAFRAQQSAFSRTARQDFEAALQNANNELMRLRLAEGPMHSVFERTILFLLKQYGSLSTQELHPLIQQIHPDLCDDTVDRVIDGKHYGKKWKHAVRTSQQHLKSKGLIVLAANEWCLAQEV